MKLLIFIVIKEMRSVSFGTSQYLLNFSMKTDQSHKNHISRDDGIWMLTQCRGFSITLFIRSINDWQNVWKTSHLVQFYITFWRLLIGFKPLKSGMSKPQAICCWTTLPMMLHPVNKSHKNLDVWASHGSGQKQPQGQRWLFLLYMLKR